MHFGKGLALRLSLVSTLDYVARCLEDGGHRVANARLAESRVDDQYASELREAIRRERMKRGVSQDAVGAEINLSGSQIGNYETGKVIPPHDVAVAFDDLFGTAGKIQTLAREARGEAVAPGLRPWTENEERATLLRTYQPLVIPGLLQTEAYARAIILAGRHSIAQAEEMIRDRLVRQATTMERADPVAITAIIGEAALRHLGPAVMKDQLEHLVDVGHRPTAYVRVLPFSVGLHPGLAGSFIVATLANGAHIGYLDNQLAGEVVTDARGVGTLERTWETLSDLALSRRQSRDLILRMIDEHDEHAPVAYVDP